MNRVNEPVTVGVPLPDGYRDASSFGLSGASVGQFRVLGRYPSGNVQWLLVDTQASVADGGTASMTLTNGSGNFGGADLAIDNGATIAVDTGTAQFRIRKANSNVFDGVTVAGKAIVSAQTGELALYAADTDAKYSSLNDAASTAVIEENGPARCCIKATGSFKDASGARLADFTLRLHFYKGKSFVRGIYTFRTDTSSPIGPLFFHAVEANVPLAITNPTATFATKTGTASQAISGADHATLFQAFSKNLEVEGGPESGPSMTWEPPMDGAVVSGRYSYTQQGLEIIAGGTTLNPLSDYTDFTQGFADLSDASGAGCTTAMRWMSAYWPAGFDFSADGVARIELYSKRNSKRNLKLRALKTESREILWDFHASPVDAAAMQLSLARVESPLLARAPLDHYVKTRAIFGQADMASPQEQATIYASQGHSSVFNLTNFAAPRAPSIYRWWGWESPGGTNQLDVALCELVDYLRGAHPTKYFRGYARAFFNATQTPALQPGQELAKIDENANDPNPYRGCVNGSFFQSEHFHMAAVPMFYWMTGDEGFRDATINLVRWWRQGITRGFDVATSLFYRPWARAFRNTAFEYEFGLQTGDYPEYRQAQLDYLKRAIDFRIDHVDDPGNLQSGSGRNYQRGYYYNCDWVVLSGHTQHGRQIFGLVDLQIACDAYHHGDRVLQQYGGYRADAIEDFREGLGRFFMAEMFDNTSTPKTGKNTDVGTLYGYSIDYPYPPPPLDGKTVVGAPYNEAIYLWPFDFSRAALDAYRATGDVTFINNALQVVWEGDDFQNGLNSREAQGQELMAASYRPPAHWTNIPLTVTPRGSDYVLTWTAPPGAKRLRIKTSTKTIVDWLGYDRVKQIYANEPATNVPWFAATDVPSVPAPSVGMMTVSGLPAGSSFSARYM